MAREAWRGSSGGGLAQQLAGLSLTPQRRQGEMERMEALVSEPEVWSMEVARSLLFFVLAGLLEIGGGYLLWQCLRESKGWGLGLLGSLGLALYGAVATLQPANFGRVYAAYGGVFIVMSVLWGWKIDGVAPDRFDLLGAAIALVGVMVMMYWPRP